MIVVIYRLNLQTAIKSNLQESSLINAHLFYACTMALFGLLQICIDLSQSCWTNLSAGVATFANMENGKHDPKQRSNNFPNNTGRVNKMRNLSSLKTESDKASSYC